MKETKQMSTDQILLDGQEYVMNTYGRLPMALVKGQGTRVWDSDGKAYLDFVTGLAVTSLGHSHPEVVEAIKEQAEQIIHSSNLYWIPNQVRLAELLAENSFADKVFFCNSGAEANEGAIKLARKYAKLNFGNHKTEIVSLKNSFHGRTLATLTATGQTKYQNYYDPLPPGFSYAELNNSEELDSAVTENTAALIIEPIQGEGGVYPVTQEFIQKAREICDQKGVLLIFDEVQCGVGRTGKLFAHEWFGVTPDIMSVAKALANGVPIGAVLATDKASCFQPGDHASTFGGNFLTTAAACKVMEIMTAEGFLQGVRKKAGYFRDKLQGLADKYGLTEEVRGLGFILGLPVGKIGPDIVRSCSVKGLLINCVGGETLRFLPPLTVSYEEIDEAISLLDQAFGENPAE
ncbi:acetylornithine aminotransferase apoenzyme [Syntrophobotulus glycolicus DSM 8271]|uniref:Acetylornithine aminotransferase n=1 Tax=Syntrophobotulus glycolicus (strain DSM 8271 / FlGlyR) TaxID=645991 RepID=F0SY48_SYNGF|nr:aspartate aminotransferase family protein [Syntrophobotulus glycolicus]ADY54798.1 acetylornithine aminotransferase apoenzyme [Syntrophobotulus glycolicus DSM 8271]